jgi:hypothetical protein
MNDPPGSSHPRIPRVRRMLARVGGLAILLAAAIGLAPAALATYPPPEPSFAPAPPPPPPATALVQFPLRVIVVFLASTIIVSVATTLITLALEHARRARFEATAAPEPQPSAQTPFTSPARYDVGAEILSSHHPRDGT